MSERGEPSAEQLRRLHVLFDAQRFGVGEDPHALRLLLAYFDSWGIAVTVDGTPCRFDDVPDDLWPP